MPLISFQTHARVKCAICHCDLFATWDAEYYTMSVTPCYDCMANAKRNALEDREIGMAEFRRDSEKDEAWVPK